jgi:hypothetical protein
MIALLGLPFGLGMLVGRATQRPRSSSEAPV